MGTLSHSDSPYKPAHEITILTGSSCNEDSGEPVKMHMLLRAFKARLLGCVGFVLMFHQKGQGRVK